jgi:hypothetical protein
MMANADAAQTLGEVERLRERTRYAIEWGWIPFLIFGGAVLLSVPFALIDDGSALGVYWLFAGPAGVLATLYAVRSLEVRTGIFERNEYLYAAVIAAMVAGAIIVGWTAEGIGSEVGHTFPIGAGLLVIALIDRSALVALTGAAIIALGAALLAAEPADAKAWVALGEGAILIAAGVAVRRSYRAGEAS